METRKGGSSEVGQPACLAILDAVHAAFQVVSFGLRQQEQKNDDSHGCKDALMRPQVTDSTDVS